MIFESLFHEEPIEHPVLGVVCGGTPVPGLNSLIASSTNYALKLGWKVLAFNDGYVHLATGDPEIVKKNSIELTKEAIKHISRTGGTIIRCDRFDPTRNPEWVSNVNKMLMYFHIRYLLILGGTDKVRSAHIISQGVDPHDMSVLVIPKTVDNDVCLPYGLSTFGFNSAINYGCKIVNSLIHDSQSVPRWYIIEIIGRQSGHLALNVGIACAVHLVIIPEAFGNKKIDMEDILDMIEAAMYKRLAADRNHGVVIISEALINHMNPKSQQKLFAKGFITDQDSGEINLEEADLSRAVRFAMQERIDKRGLKLRMNYTKLGPELRGCKPNSFDEIYSNELGFAAIEGFKQRHSNAMVIWENGIITYKSFREVMDSANRISPRKVSLDSQEYKIAYKHMWTLKREDIENKEYMERLSKVSGMTPDEFIKKFSKMMSRVYEPK